MATSKPLRIRAHHSLMRTPEVDELIAKGHEVTFSNEEYDLEIGPTCFRVLPSTLNMLDLAIKSTRAVKYPKKEKK